LVVFRILFALVPEFSRAITRKLLFILRTLRDFRVDRVEILVDTVLKFFKRVVSFGDRVGRFCETFSVQIGKARSDLSENEIS
jgi:hypothetical protein